MSKIYWTGFKDGKPMEAMVQGRMTPRLYVTEHSAKRFNDDVRRVQVLEYFDYTGESQVSEDAS